MISFSVVRASRRSAARLGQLTTPHGVVETPALVAVATLASVRTLSSHDVRATKTQLLIANAFHLHLRPGERVVQRHGGLHRFMHWPGPLMTDSGGFQVFSLGFGRDYSIGKILRSQSPNQIRQGTQPQQLTITSRGVRFRSPIDGQPLFLGPPQSIAIQQRLGADIIFAFDECPPPNASLKYLRQSVEQTHQWARRSLEAKTSKQALFGIVQGGRNRHLRQSSARFIAALPFDGFGIGGELGRDPLAIATMLGWVTPSLPASKPRHLLGTGHPEDLLAIVRSGIDTFDSIAPTHYGRHGVAFTSSGRLDLTKAIFLKDKKPLDPRCGCEICHGYSRSYISHLFRAKELTAMKLTTFHNLFFYNTVLEQLRARIKAGKL